MSISPTVSIDTPSSTEVMTECRFPRMTAIFIDRRRGYPFDPGADAEGAFAAVIVDGLRNDSGVVPTRAKHIVRLTVANPRTALNWLQTRDGASGSGPIVLIRHSDEVTAGVLAIADREGVPQRA